MKCRICEVDKLSKEFPSDSVTDKCSHFNDVCLKCMVDYVKKNKQCPDPECKAEVDPECKTIEVYEVIINQLYGIEPEVYTDNVIPESLKDGIINIKTLAGETIQIPYDPDMTIEDLKQKIKNDLELLIPAQNLKLIFNNSELKVYRKHHVKKTIKDYDLPKNSSILMIAMLYTVSDKLRNLVFDLEWGYPKSIPELLRPDEPGVMEKIVNFLERDYVDATCFIFEGSKCSEAVDHEHKQSKCGAVAHSGSSMDHSQRRGNQKITVKLEKLPETVNHLFFALSARKEPSMSRYPNPSLQLYDESEPTKSLCDTSFPDDKTAQALIMCSLSMNTDGRWQLYRYGEVSKGNTKRYQLLREKVKELVDTFFNE